MNVTKNQKVLHIAGLPSQLKYTVREVHHVTPKGKIILKGRGGKADEAFQADGYQKQDTTSSFFSSAVYRIVELTDENIHLVNNTYPL